VRVALTALEATIHIEGPAGERDVPIGEFFTLPGDTPHRETVLEPGELITFVTLPPTSAGDKSVYLKLRDRASYEFALSVSGGRSKRPARQNRTAAYSFGWSRHQALALARSRPKRPWKERPPARNSFE
jgi:CO/xanthine dehydrogenase FAD-binding subunit